MKITVYTSEHCQPCGEVKRLIQEGKLQGKEEIELIDIETDEGFAKFKREVLDHGDGAVPSAYKGGQKCNILVDEQEKLTLDCPSEVSSSE